MSADHDSFFFILNTLIKKEFPNERTAYSQAHQQGKWGKIEKLAHKMKGGAIYTGLVKLQYACQHFEAYYQSNQSLLLESLYQQIIHVMHETQVELEALVINHKF
ncbi:MAG: Hpt domain-containing protein [Legionellaceae bacterium]|nr:Hpt domain-containing protein [Legionellaceae bacterium]